MSLIVQTLTSAQGSSNYAQINDLIGQIKTQLLNVPIVTIMSDNNPAATTARIIKFKVGTSQHYYILQANGYSACKIDIDNIDHSLTTYGLAYNINSNRDGSGGPTQNMVLPIVKTNF